MAPNPTKSTLSSPKMSKLIMPQEIEVWYVLPAIRRSLAKSMVESGMRQKEIADRLGLTESAVSQYVSSKRGKDIHFPKEIREAITHSAKRLSKSTDRHGALREVQRIAKIVRTGDFLCYLHRNQDTSLPHECDICGSKARRTYHV